MARIAEMESFRKPSTIERLGISPRVFGVGCCIFSALTFTAVNICLRFLSTHGDKVWVIFMKELMTAGVVGPWLFVQTFRGRRVFPGKRPMLSLALMGLAVQWGGNLTCLWAMSVVGLSVTVPVYIGTNLAVSAFLGWLLLQERISPMSVFAIGLMCVSIVLLSMGAPDVNESIKDAQQGCDSILWIMLAVAGLIMAGTIYASMAVLIRHTVTRTASPAVVVFMITVMGCITMGPWCLMQNGLAMLAAIPLWDHFIMTLTGILNLIAFFALVKGFSLTTVAHANVLSASQVAMGVVAGMLLFAEPVSPWLLVGVSLGIAAIIMMRPASEEEIELSTGV